jgi:hypothetical protein
LGSGEIILLDNPSRQGHHSPIATTTPGAVEGWLISNNIQVRLSGGGRT